ncbi:trypsin-like peptidase domain-containing protein [Streptomyces sp. SID5785]|uniref:VMAP-C domain-containing protein n=1 Tax=Streptomyces sp. SID5785 TaxID=2690309 RepID=UPI0019283A44|nr:trypsin-like peptidase domain-containing protein [Streptomyces sp. SID5785]
MTAPQEEDPLWTLIKDAAVGLGAPPPAGSPSAGDARGTTRGLMWGSGFFVAPGWVLTCAHVLVDGPGRQARHPVRADGADVGVYVDGRVLRGRVAYAMPLPVPAAKDRSAHDRPARDRPAHDQVAHDQAAHGGATPDHTAPHHTAPHHTDEVFATEAEIEGTGAEARGQDLALVAVLDPLERERCAWLTERQPGVFGAGAVAGRFPGPSGAFAPWEAETFQCRYAGESGGRIKFEITSPLRSGTSGGLLVDTERAEVIGLVKARARDGQSGIAVPVSDLRALTPAAHLEGAPSLGAAPYRELMRRHDAWHWERQEHDQGTGEATWTDAQLARHRRPRAWGPIDRLDALHRLGALPAPPDPGTVRGLVGEALEGRTASATAALTGWRDGLGALSGIGDTEDLIVHLRYLVKVAKWALRHDGSDAAETLYDTVRQRRRFLDPAQRRRLETLSRRLRAVLLEFDDTEPAAYLEEGEEDTAHYTWALYKGYMDGRWELAKPPPAEGRPFEQARAQALSALAEVLAAARVTRPQQDPVPVEVALPGREFASAFTEWRVREGHRRSAPHTLMGDGQPVMLRDTERREALADREFGPEALRRWRARWDGLHDAGRLRPLRPVGAVGTGGAAAHRATAPAADLMTAPHGSVPVLCERVTPASGPGYAAVQHAVEAGYPVALWRADGHAAEGGCGEECAAFHREIDGLLGGSGRGGAPVGSLPMRLWRLRTGRQDGHRPDAEDGRTEGHPGGPVPEAGPPYGPGPAAQAGPPYGPDSGRPGPRADWLRGLVLFFDSPEFPLPDTPRLLESPS